MQNVKIDTVEAQDTREGIPQVIANIDSWLSVAETLKTTLGPYGRDKMFLINDEIIITNDGATILKNLRLEHPAAKLLAIISESQDKEVGDGTTSVVLLACEMLKQLKNLISEKFDIKFIKNSLKDVQKKCLSALDSLKINFTDDILYKIAQTSLTSKILKYNNHYFSQMLVDTLKNIENLDDERLLGIKKVTGGSISDSIMVNGVAFEKCFTYAGYEQQPKKIENPKIICLNIELEWKKERENCEIRMNNVEEYQSIVDTEWKLIKDRLDQIIETGANVVLSSLPIGDYATQYFARKNIFCSGRVPKEDLFRVIHSCGGRIYNSTHFFGELGTCQLFEECQVGKLRYNFFKGGSQKSYTLLLRGPGADILNEVERSVHDAVMVIKKTLKQKDVVTGGGSTEMELARILRDHANDTRDKNAFFVYLQVSRAFEIIPYQLSKNFTHDAMEVIQKLRYDHAHNNPHSGVSITKGTGNMLIDGVLEPLLVKKSMIKAAISAVSTLLMVDTTIISPKSQQ
ncbi:T-complex protein 1, eta subunit [Pseudoloma neurophilia]|uniref:CCT-eta n=1 Tax=Pseudoloma neurophilia TaxID=146866 RepID=A0A0R0M517_9MICR|nr:T-complex protein 1, eta subunit [Pseudoloma neurophilia]